VEWGVIFLALLPLWRGFAPRCEASKGRGGGVFLRGCQTPHPAADFRPPANLLPPKGEKGRGLSHRHNPRAALSFSGNRQTGPAPVPGRFPPLIATGKKCSVRPLRWRSRSEHPGASRPGPSRPHQGPAAANAASPLAPPNSFPGAIADPLAPATCGIRAAAWPGRGWNRETRAGGPIALLHQIQGALKHFLSLGRKSPRDDIGAERDGPGRSRRTCAHKTEPPGGANAGRLHPLQKSGHPPDCRDRCRCGIKPFVHPR